MLGLACRPSSPVRFGPFEAAEKCGAGVPVAGHARCCCERVCQAPIDVRGPVERLPSVPERERCLIHGQKRF